MAGVWVQDSGANTRDDKHARGVLLYKVMYTILYIEYSLWFVYVLCAHVSEFFPLNLCMLLCVCVCLYNRDISFFIFNYFRFLFETHSPFFQAFAF